MVIVMGGKKSYKLRKTLKKFGAIKTWQLILILIPLAFLIATLLRFDHLKMVDLRDQVLAADEAGNEEELKASLESLRNFVFSHTVINTIESNGVQEVILGTGPFYLEHQYLRAANAAIEAAEGQLVDDSNPNGNIYAAASAVCRPLAIQNGWAWNSPGYLNCWTTELAKYPTSETLESTILTANVPSTELYRLSYASPLWAPTWSGFAILIFALLLLIIIIRSLIRLVLQIALLFIK